jgi:hypothetical protein
LSVEDTGVGFEPERAESRPFMGDAKERPGATFAFSIPLDPVAASILSNPTDRQTGESASRNA